MYGSNGGTVFNDYSQYGLGKPITVTSTTTVTSSNAYGSSGSFNGSTSNLTLADSTDFYFPADFAIQVKYRPSAQPVRGTGATSIQMLWCQRTTDTNRIFFGYANFSTNMTGPGIWFQIDNGASSVSLMGYQTLTTNTEYDIEVSRSGNTYRIRIDGTTVSTTTSTVTVADIAAAPVIGTGWSSSFFASGQMNDLMVTKDSVANVSDYTPGKLIKTLSGTVKDNTNANAIRTVRAYPRLVGSPRFETTSASDGTWSLSVPDTECNVICLDDSAGTTYNDLIARATPV